MRARKAEYEAQRRELQWKRLLEEVANERASRDSGEAALSKLAEERLKALLDENKALRKRLGMSPSEDLPKP